jgi:hypothetical protein
MTMAIKFTPKPESEPARPAKKEHDSSPEGLLPPTVAESPADEKPGRPKAKKAVKPITEKNRELF